MAGVASVGVEVAAIVAAVVVLSKFVILFSSSMVGALRWDRVIPLLFTIVKAS